MSKIHEAMRAFGLGARDFFLSDGFWIGWAYFIAALVLWLAVTGGALLLDTRRRRR